MTFQEQTGTASRSNAVLAAGDRLAHDPRGAGPPFRKVHLDSGRSVRQAVRAYEADPRVAHAQPNYIYRVARTPDDPQFEYLWGLRNNGQTLEGIGVAGTAGRDIGMVNAWDEQYRYCSWPSGCFAASAGGPPLAP